MRTHVSRDRRTFLSLSFRGLAGLAREELRAAGADVRGVDALRNHDLLSFEWPPAAVRGLAELRLAEDVFLRLGAPLDVRRPSDVPRVGRMIGREALLDGLSLKNRVFHPERPRHPSYACFIKQDEDREVHRRRMADEIVARLGVLFPRWKPADPAAIDVWGFYVDCRLHLGLRLSDERMRYRGRAPALRPGALRPTLAAAVVFAARPRPGEMVVDPMCGTGAVLAEAAAMCPGAVVRGGDIDAAAVTMARDRLRGLDATAERWDATALSLGLASVDVIVCNLPFGRQYSSREANRRLYPRLVSHWASRLRPGGRMALLTPDLGNLLPAMSAAGLVPRVASRDVNVLGCRAAIVVAAWPAPDEDGAGTPPSRPA